jgi:glycosyltransferase involved in cell wall biosynthesis
LVWKKTKENVQAMEQYIWIFKYHLNTLLTKVFPKKIKYRIKAEKYRNRLESAKFSQRDYPNWIRLYDTIDDRKRDAIKNEIKKMNEASPLPLISVVMPVYNPPLGVLIEALDSVTNQLYSNWELCVADDASPNSRVRKLLSQYAASDKRIKVCFRSENGHISIASNSALDMATGDFVALLDHDDVLAENALFEVAKAIRNNPEAKLFYSDEDKLDCNGNRCDPYFKPDWNPDLILSQNYFCHLGVYDRKTLNQIGGFRKGFEGSQDYDILLRCVDVVGHSAVCHIPKILYHWRRIQGSVACSGESKPYAFVVAIKAIKEYLARNGIIAEVSEVRPLAGLYRIRYDLPRVLPKVSIIIPTWDRVDLLRNCMTSILDKTDYPNYEILIVDNSNVEKLTLDYLNIASQGLNTRIIRDDRPFNYSKLNNDAVAVADGDVICLLNDDTEVITPEWLTEMTSHAVRPGIGAVGARLWYPNDTLQHGGVILGIGGVAGHIYHGITRYDPGYFCRAWLIQNFSVVNGGCLVIRKSIYNEVGGFNERLTVSFNDVDFCLRVRDAGYRNLWTPFAELRRIDFAMRDLDTTLEKKKREGAEYMREKYGEELFCDPAYNLNLSLVRPFCFAFPPRNNIEFFT